MKGCASRRGEWCSIQQPVERDGQTVSVHCDHPQQENHGVRGYALWCHHAQSRLFSTGQCKAGLSDSWLRTAGMLTETLAPYVEEIESHSLPRVYCGSFGVCRRGRKGQRSPLVPALKNPVILPKRVRQPKAPIRRRRWSQPTCRREAFGLAWFDPQCARRLGNFFNSDTTGDARFEALEEALIGADVGVRTAMDVVEAVQSKCDASSDSSALRRGAEREALRTNDADTAIAERTDGPLVILAVGVNGSGKTTTIGKLAHRYTQ